MDIYILHYFITSSHSRTVIRYHLLVESPFFTTYSPYSKVLVIEPRNLVHLCQVVVLTCGTIARESTLILEERYFLEGKSLKERDFVCIRSITNTFEQGLYTRNKETYCAYQTGMSRQ